MDLMATGTSVQWIPGGGQDRDRALPFYSRYHTDGTAGVDVPGQDVSHMPGHQPLATPDRYHPAGGAVLTIQSVCWQINAHFRADAGARSGSAGPRIRPRMPR